MSLTRKPFYIMRHAQSTDNDRGLISGAGSDPDLSELGQAQANAANRLYQTLAPQPEALIVSGLKRTHQTAHLLTGRTDFIIDARLNERHLGDLDGKISEAEQKRLKTLPGEETTHAHAIRVILAVNHHLDASHLPLFICHGGTIRRILEDAGLNSTVDIGNARLYQLVPSATVWTIHCPDLI